jgi:hypothetical protein
MMGKISRGARREVVSDHLVALPRVWRTGKTLKKQSASLCARSPSIASCVANYFTRLP